MLNFLIQLSVEEENIREVWKIMLGWKVEKFFAPQLTARSANKREKKGEREVETIFKQQKFPPLRSFFFVIQLNQRFVKTYNFIHCHSSDADERIFEIRADLCEAWDNRREEGWEWDFSELFNQLSDVYEPFAELDGVVAVIGNTIPWNG